nr:hypothetical protein [Candidatus Sigynarchaeum springense]
MSTDKKEKKEVKDSNELLNIFLIVIGALFIFQGVLYYIAMYAIADPAAVIPEWILVNLGGVSTGPGQTAFAGLLGDSALMRLTLGVFAFVSGVGMFQEQEWAWGMAIVILAVIIVTTGGAVLTAFIDFGTINWASWAWYIQLISVVFAALGILWLLGTKERYH